MGPHVNPGKFGHIYVAVCVCVHACALIEEAQGREHAINWATWIDHAELTRLKCVELHREECHANHALAFTIIAKGSLFFRLRPSL